MLNSINTVRFQKPIRSLTNLGGGGQGALKEPWIPKARVFEHDSSQVCLSGWL